MIKNKRQYLVTKKQIEKLRSVLGAASKTEVKMPPKTFKAMIAGIESQIEDMEKEIREYDMLSKVESLPIDDFSKLGQLLIQTRVAKGLSQKELADLIGLKASQQIQRYEESNYATASLKRIYEIINALDIKFTGMVNIQDQDDVELSVGSAFWSIDDLELVSCESSVVVQDVSDENLLNAYGASDTRDEYTYTSNKVKAA